MKETAELIQAIAALLSAVFLPSVIAVVLFYYRKEIKDLLTRVKKGKFFGQEIELEQQTLELSISSSAALDAAPEQPIMLPSEAERIGAEPSSRLIEARFEEARTTILSTATSDPALALGMLASHIDRELREIVYSQGEIGTLQRYTRPYAIAVLKRRGLFSEPMMFAIEYFTYIYNHLNHSVDVDKSILQATVDSGIRIYEALLNIPRGVHVVQYADVPLYSDAQCANRISDANGVILISGDRLGKQTRHIFPTRGRSHTRGTPLTWEWNSNHRWGKTWYRDPDTGEIKVAWDASLEYVGRPLHLM